MFHARAEEGDDEMAKLATEADSYAKAGEERPPVKHNDASRAIAAALMRKKESK